MGTIDITGCPAEMIGRDIWEAIEYACLYEKGLPPIAGGALDQAKSFLIAASIIFEERAWWKGKKGSFE